MSYLQLAREALAKAPPAPHTPDKAWDLAAAQQTVDLARAALERTGWTDDTEERRRQRRLADLVDEAWHVQDLSRLKAAVYRLECALHGVVKITVREDGAREFVAVDEPIPRAAV